MTTPQEAVAQSARVAETTGFFSLRNGRFREVPRPPIDLATIRRVDLAGNRLVDVPGWVWEIPGLQQLELAANRLDSVGDGIANLVRLELLDVSENRLTGLPPALAACIRLRALDAAENQIADIGVIDDLRWLRGLDLGRNRISSVEQLTGATGLTFLDLSANQIGALPPGFAGLRSLRRLDLSGNLLTSGTVTLSVLPAGLVELNLDGNQLASYPGELASSRLRLSVLGNRFDPGDIGTTGGKVARAVEDMTTGAPEAGRRYLDAPTWRLPNLEVPGAVDAAKVVDLYYKRFGDVGATLRLGTQTAVDLSEVGRRRALDLLAERSSDAPATFEIHETRAGKQLAVSFLAEAAERAHLTSLVTDDGRTLDLEGPPTRRVLNVAVSDRNAALLAASESLAPHTPYMLRLDIGPASVDSVVVDAPEFPSRLVARDIIDGWWFDLVVASSWVDVDPASRRIFLPIDGASWVCDCPDEHQCRPEQRRHHVIVPFTTRDEGEASIRCTIYHHNNAVQSVRLDATVSADGAGAMAGVVDFTLSREIAAAVGLAPRDLSIVTNSTGVHTIVVKGMGTPIAVDLRETQVQTVLEAIRRELQGMTLGADGQTNQYDAANRKPAAALAADLEKLAHLGAALLAAAIPDLTDQMDLAEQMAVRSTIQVARVTGVVFPWALVYDIPHEVASPFVPCPLLVDWDAHLSQLAGYPDSCPFGPAHTLNTLCPYGFWGFHHLIEQPPSVHGDVLATTIPVGTSATAAIIHSLQLDTAMTTSHLRALEALLQPRFHAEVCTDRSTVLGAWNADALPLIYFYCHGKMAALGTSKLPVPVLEIGKDVLLGSGDFAAWARAKLWIDPQKWNAVPPLVFINGCHTAALSPEDVVSFVEAFAGIHAAGVIGTEIAVAQPTASEFANRFYTYFTDRSVGPRTVGDALYRSRMDLLAKGNVCGLTYTAFCSIDLVLGA